MIVMAPADENELRRMLYTAIYHDGPAAVRYPRGTGIGVALDDTITPVPLGKSKVVRTGDDVLILAIGRPLHDALAAAETLAEEGVACTVVNCRFVKPLDTGRIGDLVRRIPRVVTVEDNMLAGGFSSAVLEHLGDAGIGGFSLRRLGINDTFVEHGSQDVLRAAHKIDADAITDAVREILSENRPGS